MPLEGQARKEYARMYYLRHKGNLSADEAEELRQRLETQKAPLTLSDPFRPFQTFFKPFQTFSNLLFLIFSELPSPSQTFSILGEA